MNLHFQELDVRALLKKGLEPYSVIRKKVDALKSQEGLELIAPFLPSPLIEKLGSEGFLNRVEHQTDGTWVVRFWKNVDTPKPSTRSPAANHSNKTL